MNENSPLIFWVFQYAEAMLCEKIWWYFNWPGSSYPEPLWDQCWVGQTGWGPQSLLVYRRCCLAVKTSSTEETKKQMNKSKLKDFNVYLSNWPQEGRLIQRNDSSQHHCCLHRPETVRGRSLFFLLQFDMKIYAPQSWSWGWRLRWVTVREHWPSSSCWVSWATESSLSAVSGP